MLHDPIVSVTCSARGAKFKSNLHRVASSTATCIDKYRICGIEVSLSKYKYRWNRGSTFNCSHLNERDKEKFFYVFLQLSFFFFIVEIIIIRLRGSVRDLQ